MESLNNGIILKFRTETLEAVRKEINLDKKDRMREAVDILENWVRMQPHFAKRDFSRDYLEGILIASKGLVERAKERLDRLCTIRTLIPEFFAISDAKKEFSPIINVLSSANLPKLTPDNYRVFISKVVSEDNLNSSILFTFYKYLAMICDYLVLKDYSSGYVIILDYSDTNLINVMTKINFVELRQIVTIMTEGFGFRVKGIHLITSSKAVNTMVTLFKQVLSEKLASRIHTHKTIEGIQEYVPKDVLPVDYGGDEKSLKELHGQWLEILSSSEFSEYYKEMNQAKTVESCRHADKFNENYIGMPGSFRALSVD